MLAPRRATEFIASFKVQLGIDLVSAFAQQQGQFQPDQTAQQLGPTRGPETFILN